MAVDTPTPDQLPDQPVDQPTPLEQLAAALTPPVAPEPLPVRTTPALDAAVVTIPPPGPASLVKLAASPTGETGYWYCFGSSADHGGLGFLDVSRLFEYPVGAGCPVCPTCNKQQSCWVAVDLTTFPEGVTRLL